MSRPLVEFEIQDVQNPTGHDARGSVVTIRCEIMAVSFPGLGQDVIIVHGFIHGGPGVLDGEKPCGRAYGHALGRLLQLNGIP